MFLIIGFAFFRDNFEKIADIIKTFSNVGEKLNFSFANIKFQVLKIKCIFATNTLFRTLIK